MAKDKRGGVEMKRATWIWTAVLGLGAGACGSAHDRQDLLVSPVGQIQTAGAPRTVVRIADDHSYDSIRDIAVAGDDLYVTLSWGGVYRLPKYGGGITALEEGDNNVDYGELVSGDGAVFWHVSSSDSIRRVTAGGADVSTIFHSDLLSGLGDNRGKNLQLDGSTVYVTQIRRSGGDGAIHRIPANGGAEQSSILPFMEDGPGPVVPSTLPAVWVARNGGVFLARCDGAGSCAVDHVTGDGTQTIATFPGDEAYVRAADETSIYVTNMFRVSPRSDSIPPIPLLKIDQQTGAVVELTPDGSDAWDMVVDDQELFFATFNTGIMISAISKQGGDPRIVADFTESHGFSAMAQDDTQLFVLTSDGENSYPSKVIAIPKHPPAP
jgi:hypothetical protein